MSEWQETDFGRIPAHWTISNVQEETEYVTDYVANGSFASLAENVNYKNTPDYAVLIRLTDYNNGFKGDFVYVDEHAYNFLKKSKLKGGEIIISNVGAYSGTVFLAPKLGIPMTLGPNAVMMEFKDGNDFYFHWLKSPAGQFSLEGIISGSAQPKFNKTSFRAMEIPVPPIEEQHAIASVLSSLDDKIDLLHRQNQTLEQMAETLFRQWFVEEADEGWEVVQLQDIAEVKNGFAFSSKSYVDFSPEHLEVLKMGHIKKGGGLRTDPKRDYAPREERLERYILDKGDIVIAMTDMKDNVVILGVPAMIDESDRYVLNQRVARIYLKNRDSLINEYLLYVQLKDPDFIAELQSKANSGVQVNLSTASIKESEILIPPMELQQEKGNSITDLYLKKEYNDKQIKSLTKLRDTLLPKLMSGEVRIR